MRGEIWTLRDDNYANKARPVVILQAELEYSFDSVIGLAGKLQKNMVNITRFCYF